jgi:ferredoxin
MSVTLSINGQHTRDILPDRSLFELAEAVGVRVPTSCQKNGKCKECIVEVTQGSELLSPRTEQEKHLKGSFRLSCQTRITAMDGEVRCHTMRRGQMRIERVARGLPLRENRSSTPR